MCAHSARVHWRACAWPPRLRRRRPGGDAAGRWRRLRAPTTRPARGCTARAPSTAWATASASAPCSSFWRWRPSTRTSSSSACRGATARPRFSSLSTRAPRRAVIDGAAAAPPKRKRRRRRGAGVRRARPRARQPRPRRRGAGAPPGAAQVAVVKLVKTLRCAEHQPCIESWGVSARKAATAPPPRPGSAAAEHAAADAPGADPVGAAAAGRGRAARRAQRALMPSAFGDGLLTTRHNATFGADFGARSPTARCRGGRRARSALRIGRGARRPEPALRQRR